MSMGQICAQFGISRQAHYQQRQREVQRHRQDQVVLELVRQVRRKHPRMGVRKLLHRIRPMLEAQGCTIGRDRLFRLLRGENLLVRPKKPFRRTTKSGYFRAPNRLPGLLIARPNQVWVCDITYLQLQGGGFGYLFVQMDLYARYIVGWHVSSSLLTDGALICLQQALARCAGNEPLFHHSDHGVQYTSRSYLAVLQENRILPSMGAVGNCYDNAFAERLIGILKDEYLLDMPFPSLGQMAAAVKEVVHLYNTERPHLSLDMAVPERVYLGHSQEVPCISIPLSLAAKN